MRRISALIASPVFRVFLGDGLAKSCLFFANILLLRELSVAEYSVFAVLSSAIFLGYQLACSPIERLYIAEHQRFRFVAKPFLMAFSIVAALFSYITMVKQHTFSSFAVVFLGVLLLGLYQFFRIQLQQRQWFIWFSAAELIKNTLWIVSLLFFLYAFFAETYSGIISIVLLIGASVATLLIISLFLKIKEERENGAKLSWSETLQLLSEGKFVFGYSLVAAIHPYVPFILVAQYADDQTVGSYGGAMRYVGVVSMLGAALNVVFLPRMAMMKSEPDLLEGFVVSFVKRFLFLAPAILVFALFVSWLIRIFDDGKYPNLPYIFMAFSLLQVISIFSAPFINLLLINRRSMALLLIMGAGVLMSLSAAFTLRELLPNFSPIVGTCLGYVMISVLAVRLSQRSIKKSNFA